MFIRDPAFFQATFEGSRIRAAAAMACMFGHVDIACDLLDRFPDCLLQAGRDLAPVMKFCCELRTSIGEMPRVFPLSFSQAQRHNSETRRDIDGVLLQKFGADRQTPLERCLDAWGFHSLCERVAILRKSTIQTLLQRRDFVDEVGQLRS